MTKQVVAKEISTLVVDDLEDVLQCAYERPQMAAHSVVYIIFEQIPFDLMHQEVMEEIFDKHIANYFDTTNAADKICEKTQSGNALL